MPNQKDGKKKSKDEWNWQTTLLLIVVALGILLALLRYLATGSDIPSGVITLLSFFGGAILGVQRLGKHWSAERERVDDN